MCLLGGEARCVRAFLVLQMSLLVLVALLFGVLGASWERKELTRFVMVPVG